MKLRQFFGQWEVFLIGVVLLTFVVGAFCSDYFLTQSNIAIAIASAVPTAIIALPMTLIVICGEIDISVGSLVGLCAATIGVLVERNVPVEIAILAALTVGAAAGALNGFIVAYIRVPSLVVTLGTLAMFRGLAMALLEERGVSSFPDWYQTLGFGTVPLTPFPWSVFPFLILCFCFMIVLHGTVWGRRLYAIGNNRVAAEYSGIDSRRLIFVAFVLSGVMCALAAVVLTGYLASARSDTATGLELSVVTAVVLGGVNIFGGSGKLTGVVLAVLALALVQNVLGLIGVTPERQQVVTGGVLIAALILFGGARRLNATLAGLFSAAPRGGAEPSQPT
jgi:rhamnose transport system permease protein